MSVYPVKFFWKPKRVLCEYKLKVSVFVMVVTGDEADQKERKTHERSLLV